MSRFDITVIFVMLLLNIMISHKIQTDRIRDIDKRISRIELLEFFRNNIDIKEEEKEEKTLQKKDKNI